MIKGGKYFFITFVLLSVFFYACKQGCRDPKALNYNPGATSDNGTCLYCDTATFTSSVNAVGFDETFDSPHEGQEVINAIITQKSRGATGNGCQTIGRQFIPLCSTTLNILNLTNQTMSGQCLITATFFQTGFGSSSWTSTTKFTNLAPNSSVGLGQINANCDTLINGSIQMRLDSMKYF